MAYSSNISVTAGTNYVKVDGQYYPLGALALETNLDKNIRIIRISDGKQITDMCNFAEYKDTSNVPYTSFALAIAGITALIFE